MLMKAPSPWPAMTERGLGRGLQIFGVACRGTGPGTFAFLFGGISERMACASGGPILEGATRASRGL